MSAQDNIRRVAIAHGWESIDHISICAEGQSEDCGTFYGPIDTSALRDIARRFGGVTGVF